MFTYPKKDCLNNIKTLAEYMEGKGGKKLKKNLDNIVCSDFLKNQALFSPKNFLFSHKTSHRIRRRQGRPEQDFQFDQTTSFSLEGPSLLWEHSFPLFHHQLSAPIQ